MSDQVAEPQVEEVEEVVEVVEAYQPPEGFLTVGEALEKINAENDAFHYTGSNLRVKLRRGQFEGFQNGTVWYMNYPVFQSWANEQLELKANRELAREAKAVEKAEKAAAREAAREAKAIAKAEAKAAKEAAGEDEEETDE